MTEREVPADGPVFRFTMRAVPRDPTGYYHSRWDRAQHITVIAETRQEAMRKASDALGENNQGWPWTFNFIAMDETDRAAAEIGRSKHE